jgi:hypothetical protein
MAQLDAIIGATSVENFALIVEQSLDPPLLAPPEVEVLLPFEQEAAASIISKALNRKEVFFIIFKL